MAAFYIWTAATSFPFALNGAQANPYNELASAFLHLHLSVGRAPAGLLRLSEPYNPEQNAAFQSGAYAKIHDFALYRGQLYLTWGPVPAIALMPLQLLGIEPSASLVAAFFAVVGLGFVLATLRVLLRRLGEPAPWMGGLAALTLGLASAIPFLLRRPEIYEEEIGAGFCFAMAAVWLAISTLADRQASLRRLALMSLCFGLAAGSRVTLALTAVLLVPVYLSMRPTRTRRELLPVLTIPVGACVLLLMLYNQARFGSPLEVGAKYQLSGYDQMVIHFGELSYIPPGAWYYLFAPPRLTALFPFAALAPPPGSYPFSLPARYLPTPEVTAGLLPMAPVLLFLAALPCIWRRRPNALGPLAVPVLLLAGAGLTILVFVSYEFFSTTERYEADFSTLLLLGALTAWLALWRTTGGRMRRLVQASGALLAIWSCLTGVAISFVGYANLLQVEHPKTWRRLEDVTSPISTAIAALAGHPVLTSVAEANLMEIDPSYTTLGYGPTTFWLGSGEQASVIVVSPDSQQITLVAELEIGPALSRKGALGIEVRDHGRTDYRQLQTSPLMRIPVQVGSGANRLSLGAFATALNPTPESPILVTFKRLSLAGESQ